MTNPRTWLCVAAIAGVVAPRACAAMPSFEGNWQVIDPPAVLHTITGELPPLLPPARAIYDGNLKQRAGGDVTVDTTTRCLPPGVPRIMYQPAPFQIVQRADAIFMLFEYQHLNRMIFFGTRHLPRPGHSFLGDSIARWDGDTLVVDTNGMKDGTALDSAGLPHTRDLDVVERYSLSPGGNEMADRITISDPATYARPWQTIVRFKRLGEVAWREDVCTDRQPNWFADMLKANQ